MGEPKREVESKWSRQISEQSQSGQTVEAFCRERGLTTSQFYTWRKRLRRSSARQFLEVQVTRTPSQPTAGPGRAIEICLSGGQLIRVEPGFDAKHLRAVVAALETRG